MTPARTFTIGGDLTVNRVGFGAMRIIGPEIQGTSITTPRPNICTMRSSEACAG